MCDQCQDQAAQDRIMWESIRLGLLGMNRGMIAIIKAIEKRYGIQRERKGT